MLRDKERDIARAVLPSCARKWARDKGRYIARARRRAFKEALLYLDPEDWDDGDAYRHVGNRLSRLRSDECWRIQERRGSDKLGPLKSWTKHHKKTSDTDDEAYEKICKVLDPGRNLITRHAIDHVEAWLDLEKDKYRYSYRYNYRQPESILTKDHLLQIVTTLFETAHKQLNKCFKEEGLRKDRCKDEDPCSSYTTYTNTIYEYYVPAIKRWTSTTYGAYIQIQGLKRIRKVENRYPFHSWRLCPNKMLIHNREDLSDAVRALSGNHSRDALTKLGKRSALYRVLQLAKKHNLLHPLVEELV
jgi:hypothetical protein